MESENIYNLISHVVKFRDERNWKQFHNIKDLVISLSLETSELLENFQWKNNEEALAQNIENIKDELADVLIYSLLLTNDLSLDVTEIVHTKLKKNREKYPIEKAYGIKRKYTDL
jgi:NTP pyrophosphatase (non-canonical NTP hydrolase)